MRAALLCLVVPSVAQLVVQPFADELPQQPLEESEITVTINEPTICDNVKQYSGYLNTKKPLFFWFFESRNDPSTDPTLLWLTGGPGCSSQMALLAENGPCGVSSDGTTSMKNPYSWNSKANALWVDQPAGSGFSGGKWDSSSTESADDLYDFLLAFFAKFPQYNKNFYIFGESYAGHYVPATAYRIFTGNKNATLKIDLKGFSIGNGLTDPEEQYAWYPTMAYKSGTAPPAVNEVEYKLMQAAVGPCQAAIRKCNSATGVGKVAACKAAFVGCNVAMQDPYRLSGKNPYNMNIKCEKPPLCYDFSRVSTFLNNKTIQSAIGVSKSWSDCNMAVNLFFQNDWMITYKTAIPEMLESGMRVLIYAGDLDYICNWIGNKEWVTKMTWEKGDAFRAAQDVEWKGYGKLRKAGQLAFLQVYKAGHMVPMDQPEAALAMVEAFLSDDLKDTTTDTETILV